MITVQLCRKRTGSCDCCGWVDSPRRVDVVRLRWLTVEAAAATAAADAAAAAATAAKSAAVAATPCWAEVRGRGGGRGGNAGGRGPPETAAASSSLASMAAATAATDTPRDCGVAVQGLTMTGGAGDGLPASGAGITGHSHRTS